MGTYVKKGALLTVTHLVPHDPKDTSEDRQVVIVNAQRENKVMSLMDFALGHVEVVRYGTYVVSGIITALCGVAIGLFIAVLVAS